MLRGERPLAAVDEQPAADDQLKALAQEDHPQRELDAPHDRRGEQPRGEFDEAERPEREHHRAEQDARGGDDRHRDERGAGDRDRGHGLEGLHRHGQAVEEAR